MKKVIISIFFIVTSIGTFNGIKEAQAVSISCSGDISVVCAQISLPNGGVATAYGDKGVIKL